VRVVVDTTYARRAPYSGTAIYIERVCDELSQLADLELVEVHNRRRRPPAGGGVGSARNLVADLTWTNIELPRLARRAGADLIHHPLPARAIRAEVPQVITVADLAFERLPEHFDPLFRMYAHRAHRAAAHAAGAVLCVSETTAEDVRELWRVAPEKLVVAPHGPGQEFGTPTMQRPARPTHFLYVGDQEPRKNLDVLLRAYRGYREIAPDPLDLVLAGSASSSGPGIRVVNRPPPADLGELYLRAAALIQPSLYEGFGLTGIEAMKLGTPVLAARSPGITEVCRDAALYADPTQPESFTASMVQLARDEALRTRRGERGRVRASEFSWAACARAHVSAYSLALDRR
jgi:glycosyltransferase involved in cell wall biosynthesis